MKIFFAFLVCFASADGNTKGTIAAGDYGWGSVASNLDIYVNLNTDNYITLDQPTSAYNFLSPGEKLEISASASSAASSFKIWLDEGSGYVEAASVASANNVSYMHSPSSTSNLGIKNYCDSQWREFRSRKIHKCYRHTAHHSCGFACWFETGN